MAKEKWWSNHQQDSNAVPENNVSSLFIPFNKIWEIVNHRTVTKAPSHIHLSERSKWWQTVKVVYKFSKQIDLVYDGILD